jgi:Ser/Thr protein kinase RdoA (MazF antagonist)
MSEVPARAPGWVHGMGRECVAADWPALTDDEVRRVLARLDRDGRATAGVEYRVHWSSPRPLSAAAVVRGARCEYFVKRHHVSVRDGERLRVEHAFASHLRDRGQPVARVLADGDGDTVWREGDYLYEVHETAPGVDRYRDVPSWYPYATLDHARSAGSALARFHDAAADFAASASPPGVVTNSVAVLAAADPLVALDRLVSARPALARALEGRDLVADVAGTLGPRLGSAASHLGRLAAQWAHGDWHPSNLTWSSGEASARVAGVLDLGLANRTVAVHDVALALERATVDWLDLAGVGEPRADLAAVDALLDGYEQVRVLDEDEWAALVAVLPVVHLEFALSEVEYFFDVVHSSANTDLAYDGYLLGHARWFETAAGVELVEHLGRRAARAAVIAAGHSF